MTQKKTRKPSGRSTLKSVNSRRGGRKPVRRGTSSRGRSRSTTIAVVILLIFAVVALILISRSVILKESDRRAEAVETTTSSTMEAVKQEKSSRKKITDDARPNPHAIAFTSDSLELPSYRSDEIIISNNDGRYTISYDNTHRQALWVAYTLTSSDLKKRAERKDKFVPDPEVMSRNLFSAHNSDYTHSGYDKGHLLPSADRSLSQKANDATFYLSNISPQRPNLNRKTWRLLEERVRDLTDSFDTIYIVTGGVVEGNVRVVGANKVAVPDKFFKTLLGKSGKRWISIGFVMPNSDDVSSNFRGYAVTVDSVERLTGLDIYPRLPDDIERQVEATFDIKQW